MCECGGVGSVFVMEYGVCVCECGGVGSVFVMEYGVMCV